MIKRPKDRIPGGYLCALQEKALQSVDTDDAKFRRLLGMEEEEGWLKLSRSSDPNVPGNLRQPADLKRDSAHTAEGF